MQLDIDALRHLGFRVLEGNQPAALPIATDRYPSVREFLEPVGIMLSVACAYLNLDDDLNGVRWMRAALWCESSPCGCSSDANSYYSDR